jgi:hypothetical protein
MVGGGIYTGATLKSARKRLEEDRVGDIPQTGIGGAEEGGWEQVKCCQEVPSAIL